MTLPTNEPEHAITRRAVVKAAAWTVPVVAVAAAAPGASASTGKNTLEFKWGSFQNTWGDLFRGSLQPMVSGDSSNPAVTALVVTITFDPTTLEIDPASWEDSTSDNTGWTLTKPLSNGVVEFSWVSATGLVPNGPDYQAPIIGFGFSYTSGGRPTSFGATVASAQANSGAIVIAAT